MKLHNVCARNFGSYKAILFDLDCRKLTLVSGDTGSGKSTLCDLVPWTLYGKTAKGGSVTEVCRWGTTEPTTSTINLKVGDEFMSVSRTRGSSNDLFFVLGGSEVRGKDLADTQRLLDSVLGANVDLFLASAYFHEFSQVASFFISNAKTRRTIIEQLVDMSFPIEMMDRIAESKKANKEGQLFDEKDVQILEKSLLTAKDKFDHFLRKQAEWESAKNLELANLEFKGNNFTLVKEQEIANAIMAYETLDAEKRTEIKKYAESLHNLKAQLVPVDPLVAQKQDNMALRSKYESIVCQHCGSFTAQKELLALMEQDSTINKILKEQARLRLEISGVEEKFYKLKETPNHYAPLVEQKKNLKNYFQEAYQAKKEETNPYTTEVAAWAKGMHDSEKDLLRASEFIKNHSEHKADLELLQDLVANLRGQMMTESISLLETYTNQLLETHFDAEIRVLFSSDSADKIDISIHKNENVSTYSQLSKGQRQILKLCFGVSVMRLASEKHGIDINVAFFDEALDGLSEEFKLKAYGLLKALENRYESIFCVEHSSELKAHFENKIQVRLIDEKSEIEETS